MHPTDLPTPAQAEYLRRGLKIQSSRRRRHQSEHWRGDVFNTVRAVGWVDFRGGIYCVTRAGIAAIARYDAKQEEAKR